MTATGAGGTVTVYPDGTFSYDPTDAARLKAGFTQEAETDGFTVTITDGHGGTTAVPVTGVTVSPAQLGVTATIPTGASPYDIAFTADGSRAYVSTADTHTVRIVDTATNTVTDVMTIPTLSSNFISVNDDGTLIYAGVDGGHSIGVIDSDPASPTFESVIAVIPVGSGVSGQALSPDGSRLYVNNYSSGSVSVIDLESKTLIATVPVGTSPWDIAITPDGTRAFVVNTDSASVSVIDTSTNTVTATVGVANRSHGVALSANGARVYVANSNSNTVTVIDTATNTVIKTIGVSAFPSQVSSSPDGSLVYVAAESANAVTVIDTSTDTVIATVPVGRYPWGVTVGPNGDAYVSNLSAFPWDPTGGPNVSVISLVTGQNTAPTALTPAYTVDNLYPVTGIADGSVRVTDVDADTLSYSAPATSTKGGAVGINQAGVFTYTPTTDVAAQRFFRQRARRGQAGQFHRHGHRRPRRKRGRPDHRPDQPGESSPDRHARIGHPRSHHRCGDRIGQRQ